MGERRTDGRYRVDSSLKVLLVYVSWLLGFTQVELESDLA